VWPRFEAEPRVSNDWSFPWFAKHNHEGTATNWALGPASTPFNSTNAYAIDTSIGSSLFPLYNITSLLFQLSTLKLNLFAFAYFCQFNTLTHWPLPLSQCTYTSFLSQDLKGCYLVGIASCALLGCGPDYYWFEFNSLALCQHSPGR